MHRVAGGNPGAAAVKVNARHAAAKAGRCGAGDLESEKDIAIPIRSDGRINKDPGEVSVAVRGIIGEPVERKLADDGRSSRIGAIAIKHGPAAPGKIQAIPGGQRGPIAWNPI